MNKIVYAAFIGCLVISSAVNCYGEWETTGWFARAPHAEQLEAYCEEVVYPVLRDEIKNLEKDAQWATKETDAWEKSYYRSHNEWLQRAKYYEDQPMYLYKLVAQINEDASIWEKRNWHRKLAAQAIEDKQVLEKHGKEIILGWAPQFELNNKCRLRDELAKAAGEFRKKYDITLEQEEKLVLSERKSSGVFFSSLE